MISINSWCVVLVTFFVYSCSGYSLDGYSNCAVVPSTVEEIRNISVIITGLDPSKTYEITPLSGAVMYWPGNSAEDYQHFAWSIAVTPENCGMGTATLAPLCGSKDELTCCMYSTARLGAPPPLLHSKSTQTAFRQVSNNVVQIRGQNNVWVWFEDDNCENNIGELQFNVTAL